MITWLRVKFMDWRLARDARDHDKWMKHFEAELVRDGSATNTEVITRAARIAQGMIMRWMDDRGVRRCAFCIGTDQIQKRVIQPGIRLPTGKISGEKVVFTCAAHAGVQFKIVDPVKSPEGNT